MTPQRRNGRITPVEQEVYWQKALGGHLPVLNFHDHPRPLVQSFVKQRESVELNEMLIRKVEEFCSRENVMPFVVLLTVLKILLLRYTEQSDIIVGSLFSDSVRKRGEDGWEHFANPVALRTHVSGNLHFRELLHRVSATIENAAAHRDCSFEKVIEFINGNQDLGRAPVFQVMFVLRDAPLWVWTIPNSEALTNIGEYTARCDLVVTISVKQQMFEIHCEYDAELFEPATIAGMLGHYQLLLESIVNDPNQLVSLLPMLTEAERHQLLVEWNNTRVEYPKDCYIHQAFEAQVERTPDAVAVVFEDQQLTYRELNLQANQLAHYLRKCGVGSEVRVGICVERSLEMVVGLLGILKAGGAYVPLDLSYPTARLSFMLADARVPVLVTQQRLLEELPEHKARIVCLDTDWEVVGHESQKNLSSGVRTENLAYVIYTSGSTGKPKGVEVSHRAVVNFLESMRAEPGMTEADRLLSLTSLSFDIAGLEIYLPLVVGARVTVASKAVSSDGPRLRKLLEKSGATVVQATPATWRLLVEAGWQGNPHLKILCGGEALPRELANELLVRGASLWNLYGPTESTIWSTVCKVLSTDGPVSIGRPLANTQVYILDHHLQPVPVGIPGELHIGGVGLARGYLRRPELTADKFIPDPFSNEPGGRLYQTGDLVRYRRDGDIEFLGRLDHQIKIRGFRIECGEIETVLNTHTAVREAVVVAREDGLGEKRLVAYIVPAAQRKMDITELRNLLRGKLPEYMMPSAFVMIEKLPMTPNGKVDRGALPSPEHSRPELESTFVAPRTLMEKSLAGIWGEVLKLERVGIRDNFFDLGGHSLLATQLLSRVRKAFQVELPLRVLFEFPTIEGLVPAVVEARELTRKGKATKYSSLVVPFQTGGSNPPCFLHGVSFELSRYLGLDQPSYGLVPYGHDGRQAPNTVEEMAANYLNEIRAVQPKGPYFIGGYSFGGIVAFEMAQQLHRQGQSVGLLVLLDPTPPSGIDSIVATVPQSPSSKSKDYLDEFVHHLQNLKQLSLTQQGRYILDRLKWRGDQIRNGIKMMVCKLHHYTGFRVPPGLRMFYFTEVSQMATRRYIPKPYPSRLVLLKSQDGVDNSQAIWTRLTCGGVEFHELPGKHLDPIRGLFVKDWGKQLKNCLLKAQGRMSRPVPRLSQSRSA